MKTSLLTIPNIMRLLGILLVIGALFGDRLFMSSAGIGPLQWMGIIIGILIFLLTFLPKSVTFGFGTSVITVLVMILLFEGGLALAGREPDYTLALIDEARQVHTRLSYYNCDRERGCYYIPENLPEEMCPQGTRLCGLNEQGYYDNDDFVASDAIDNAEYRILMLGDSFTFGMTSSIGNSYVEILERELQASHDVMVWNLGVVGTGTKQALLLAETYMPTMQPDLVVLGVYENDFMENDYPLDMYEQFELDGEMSPLTIAYRLTGDEPEHLSDENLYLRMRGRPASYSQTARILRLTRLGSLLVNAVESVQHQDFSTTDELPTSAQIDNTENLLGELQSYVIENNADFLVLHVPALDDYPNPTKPYTTFQEMTERLDIPRFEVYDLLEEDDYVLTDLHWNDAGHQAVGDALVACLDIWIETDDFCEAVN